MNKQELREIIENELENDIEIIKAKQQHERAMENLKHENKKDSDKNIINLVFGWVVGIVIVWGLISILTLLITTALR